MIQVKKIKLKGDLYPLYIIIILIDQFFTNWLLLWNEKSLMHISNVSQKVTINNLQN